MINKIISFKQIPFIKRKQSDGEIKIASPYYLPQKYDKDVFVKIEEDCAENEYKTEITDDEYNKIATNCFRIDKEERVLKNAGMDVWHNSHRGNGFGIVLHLNNVMELLENDLERIELFSMGEAILFHGKCKYRPHFKDKDTIEEALYQISLKDYKKFPPIEEPVDKAVKYLNEIHITGGFYSLNKDKINYAEDIVSNYIEALNTKKLTPEEREEYGFVSGFNMVLTKEKILENRDFFNKLFEKHGIDYKIKDPQ